MDIWKSEVWKDKYKDHNVRKGLRLKFDRGIDEKLKTGFKEYCRWLRSEYTFPIRVPVYVKNFKQTKNVKKIVFINSIFIRFEYYFSLDRKVTKRSRLHFRFQQFLQLNQLVPELSGLNKV